MPLDDGIQKMSEAQFDGSQGKSFPSLHQYKAEVEGSTGSRKMACFGSLLPSLVAESKNYVDLIRDESQDGSREPGLASRAAIGALKPKKKKKNCAGCTRYQ